MLQQQQKLMFSFETFQVNVEVSLLLPTKPLFY